MTSITSQTIATLAQIAAGTTLRCRAIVLRYLRNWDEQAAVNQLRRLDDRLLRDVGINRGDLEWVAQLPLSISPKDALRTRVHRP